MALGKSKLPCKIKISLFPTIPVPSLQVHDSMSSAAACRVSGPWPSTLRAARTQCTVSCCGLLPQPVLLLPRLFPTDSISFF